MKGKGEAFFMGMFERKSIIFFRRWGDLNKIEHIERLLLRCDDESIYSIVLYVNNITMDILQRIYLPFYHLILKIDEKRSDLNKLNNKYNRGMS